MRVLPMVVASAGLFGATAPTQKKIDKKDVKDCNYLCLPSPMQECDAPWDLSAAATYQQVRVQAGEVAAVTNDRLNQIFPSGGLGIQPYDDFAWGFQVGAGYTDYERNWRVGVNYNYFKAIFNSPYETAYGQAFAPSQYANSNVDNIGQARFSSNIPLDTAIGPATDQWQSANSNEDTLGQARFFSSSLFTNLDYGNYTLFNNVDVLVARPSMITPNLEFTTQFGIDVQFLQRRQISVFTNSTQDTTLTGYISNLGGYFQNYQKYTWWGVGPEIGFHSNWHLGSNFFFFFDGQGSLAYGLSTARSATFSKLITNVNSFLAQEAATQNSMYQWSPAMKYLLGLSWSRVMDSSEARLSFKIAYSSQYFFYLMRSIQPEGAYRSENGAGFGLQGLILSAAIDF